MLESIPQQDYHRRFIRRTSAPRATLIEAACLCGLQDRIRILPAEAGNDVILDIPFSRTVYWFLVEVIADPTMTQIVTGE